MRYIESQSNFNFPKVRRLPVIYCPNRLAGMEVFSQAFSFTGNNSFGAASLTGLLLLLVVYTSYKLTAKKVQLPPGPKGWPVVGSLLDFSGTSDSVTIFENYRKVHGNLYTVYFGTIPFVVLNGYGLIKEALITKGNDFAGRFAPHSLQLFSRNGKSILAGQLTSEWYIQRKLLHNALRKYATGKHLEETVQEACRATTDYLLQKSKEGQVDPLHAMALLMYNITGGIGFGKIYDTDDNPELKTLMRLFDSVNDFTGSGVLADYFPYLGHLPLPATVKFKRDLASLQAFYKQKWDEHNSAFDPTCVTDLTFHIIKLREELRKSNEGSGAPSQLTEEHYLEIISDFVFAATDTNRFTLSWCLLYLASHFEVQVKMQEEIDKAIGDKEINLSDRQNLPYTEAVLHEVMRLRPIASQSIPHETTCETMIGGYSLPPHTPVLVNIMSLHMDPKSFPEPHKFKPERFLDENGKFQSRPGEWMPFSTGRRVCVGEAIAKVVLHVLLAMLLQKFSFFPPDGKDVDLSCQDMALFMLTKQQFLTVRPRF